MSTTAGSNTPAPGPMIDIQFHLDDDSITSQRPIIIKTEDAVQPYELNKIADDAATSNESFNYSGRHDHGPNAALKEGGYYAQMITALNEAKDESNAILSAEIDTQKERENGNQKKKTRINEADAYT